jgi:hypothetical protein
LNNVGCLSHSHHQRPACGLNRAVKLVDKPGIVGPAKIRSLYSSPKVFSFFPIPPLALSAQAIAISTWPAVGGGQFKQLVSHGFTAHLQFFEPFP